MLEKYESFSTKEKEEFRDICNELFDKTFLNEEVISNDGGFVINEKFNFVRRNFELFEEYFMLSGWILERKNNETIYIRNETGSNRVILKLLTTKMLIALRATLKKGGFMRQKQKNNFSLRLACVGGALTAENLKKIAEVAEKYGDGYVHLTSRQGVEIPFIKLDDIDDVTADLAKGGCRPGVCGPRVRTVTACQGNAVCPSGNINSYDIAVKLNERYFGRELPHKFKFGVTGCQNNCLKAEENDVGIKGAAQISWKEDTCIHCGVCEKSYHAYLFLQ